MAWKPFEKKSKIKETQKSGTQSVIYDNMRTVNPVPEEKTTAANYSMLVKPREKDQISEKESITFKDDEAINVTEVKIDDGGEKSVLPKVIAIENSSAGEIGTDDLDIKQKRKFEPAFIKTPEYKYEIYDLLIFAVEESCRTSKDREQFNDTIKTIFDNYKKCTNNIPNIAIVKFNSIVAIQEMQYIKDVLKEDILLNETTVQTTANFDLLFKELVTYIKFAKSNIVSSSKMRIRQKIGTVNVYFCSGGYDMATNGDYDSICKSVKALIKEVDLFKCYCKTPEELSEIAALGIKEVEFLLPVNVK